MKKENKIVTNLLKAYYTDMSIIELKKIQIRSLNEANLEDSKVKIAGLKKEIKDILRKNCQMVVILDDLRSRMPSELTIIEYKFKLGKNNAQIVTGLSVNDSCIWQKETKVYNFIYNSLDSVTLERGLRLSNNKINMD